MTSGDFCNEKSAALTSKDVHDFVASYYEYLDCDVEIRRGIRSCMISDDA